jgi:hypothetical protein
MAAKRARDDQGVKTREQEARAAIAAMPADVSAELLTRMATEYPLLRDDQRELAAVHVLVERARGRTIAAAVAECCRWTPHRLTA